MDNLRKIMLVITILSLPISFTICSIVGEVAIFSYLGLIRYMWIILLFLPIPILSLVICIYSKKKKKKYKLSFLITIISLLVLLIIGSYGTASRNIIDYDNKHVSYVEEKIGFKFPNQMKIASLDYGEYVLTYSKINNQHIISDFEHAISNNDLWGQQVSTKIKGCLPISLNTEISQIDYYLVYNVTKSSYDIDSFDSTENEMIFIGYDKELSRLIMISNFIVKVIE